MWVQLASWQTPSTCTGLTGIYELLLRRSPDLMNIRSRTPFELTFHLFLEKRCFSPRHCATNYTVHFSDIKGKSSIGKNNFARIVTTLLYDISTIMEKNRKKKRIVILGKMGNVANGEEEKGGTIVSSFRVTRNFGVDHRVEIKRWETRRSRRDIAAWRNLLYCPVSRLISIVPFFRAVPSSRMCFQRWPLPLPLSALQRAAPVN